MEFHVPQFIDVENKIFMDLSFEQILYIVGGVFISYVLFKSLPSYVSIIPIGVIMITAGLLAFYPKDRYGKPFVGLMESAFRFFFIRPRLYTWKHVRKTPVEVKKEDRNTLSVTVPNISESNLKSLAWGLDVKKNV